MKLTEDLSAYTVERLDSAHFASYIYRVVLGVKAGHFNN